jgi:hypothetical protein
MERLTHIPTLNARLLGGPARNSASRAPARPSANPVSNYDTIKTSTYMEPVSFSARKAK